MREKKFGLPSVLTSFFVKVGGGVKTHLGLDF